MKLFQIDYLNKMKTLLSEAFKFKKYKAMSIIPAILTGLLMLPFVAISFVLIVIMTMLSYSFALISSPIKYLHELMHEEGQSVKHATQTVVYLVSWPLVFFLYVLMSSILLLILPTYAALSITCYVWSLGGFKFHVFPDKIEDISINVNGRYSLLPIIFIFVAILIILIIPMIHAIILYDKLYSNYNERLFVPLFFGLGGVYWKYIILHIGFSGLYSFIGFAHSPKQISYNEE